MSQDTRFVEIDSVTELSEEFLEGCNEQDRKFAQLSFAITKAGSDKAESMGIRQRGYLAAAALNAAAQYLCPSIEVANKPMSGTARMEAMVVAMQGGEHLYQHILALYQVMRGVVDTGEEAREAIEDGIGSGITPTFGSDSTH